MPTNTFITGLLLLVVSIGAVAAISSRAVPAVIQTNLEYLPMEIDGYGATEAAFPESVYAALNADKNVYRHYRNRNGDQMDLYIGYYGTAKGGRTGHNPYACLPSEGLAIIDTGKIAVRQDVTGKSVQLNYVLARKDGMNTVMLHWYQTAGTTVVSTGIRQNIERFTGRLLFNRNDGAFIRITTQVPGSQVADSTEKVRDFAGKILNLIPGYWPLEK